MDRRHNARPAPLRRGRPRAPPLRRAATGSSEGPPGGRRVAPSGCCSSRKGAFAPAEDRVACGDWSRGVLNARSGIWVACAAMSDRIERITRAYRAVMIAARPGVVWWGRMQVTGVERLPLEGPLLVV